MAVRHTVSAYPAAPSWISLNANELDTALEFYGPLMGWSFRPGPERWGPYMRAEVDGIPVAGIGTGGHRQLNLPVSWTTYFGIEDIEASVRDIHDRGGTVAVGPLTVSTGRILIAADPTGTPFGVWEGRPGIGDRPLGPGLPVTVELRTPDPFAAAMFYAEVFRWDDRDPERFEVRWEHNRVLLRVDGLPTASLRSSRTPSHRWDVYFTVGDVEKCSAHAERLGGTVLEGPLVSPYGIVARLRDPEGGEFLVTAAQESGRPED
ncbi:VOC family protein [Streptacidiphilus monticola]|uniref:VOC family protein n=1 Tax=Streptacidiphilus monticola TaxID=2161674 RepID=A0ABW1FYT9_9ACTN